MNIPEAAKLRRSRRRRATVQHVGVGISGGGDFGGKEFQGNLAGGMLSGLNGSGHASGTTQAAVSEGSITVRDKDNQQQNIADLSRDTENANGSIAPIFDKEKEQNRLKQAQLIGEIGSQAMDIARTQGKIAEEKALKDPNAIQAAKEALAVKGNLTPTDKQVTDQVRNTASASYGTGSALQQGIQAATAAIQGLAGGNLGQALSGAAAPYLAEQIHKLAPNEASRAMAHAVVGAVTAYASGNNAAAGAAGAVSGELMAQLVMKQLYAGRDVSDLSENEKQTISMLGTLAAGLAGGVTGNRTSDALAGAQAGKNAVENNALSLPSGMMDYGQSVASYVQYAQDNNLPPEQVKADMERMVKGDLPEGADIIKTILENNPGTDTIMALLSAEDAKDYALALLSSIPAERALALVGKAVKVIDNNVIIKAAEKISTAKSGKQFTAPRDLNEQVLWNQVEKNPSSGVKFSDKGMDLNVDPRFPKSSGFEKMTVNHELPDGKNIEIHYQYNSVTNKAYDMKIITPKRSELQPGPSFGENK